jgi:predicted dehydrogenase
MNQLNRRQFIRGSLAAGAALAMPASRVLGANNDIRLGVIGVGSSVKIGGMGKNEIRAFLKLPGIRFTALCDCDQANLMPEINRLREHNPSIRAYTDMRELLDDKNVDAVIVTTPNHWHALATIWACQAGKDVYVQKPTSHTIFEGRKMVEAARKYNRIVQAPHGPRERTGFGEAFEYVRKGSLGKILYAHGLNYKPRESIGKVNGPQPIPDSINYDLWCGPADKLPLMRQHLHYDWHFDFNTGNGDLGNMGIHYMDGCRWGLGQNTLPRHVMSLGGRFGYDDDGQTPNTQIVFLDYEPAPIIFEVRGLPRSRAQRGSTWRASDMDSHTGVRIGTIIRCESGYVTGRSGGGGTAAAFDHDGKLIRQFEPTKPDLRTNFLDAIRSRRAEEIISPVLQGHLSAALVHLGNISYRLGARTDKESVREAIQSEKPLAESFDRFVAHLDANEIDLGQTPIRMGPMLSFDPQQERFTGPFSEMANTFVSRNYREPYVVPNEV